MDSALTVINKKSNITVDKGIFSLFIIAFTLLYIREAFRLQQIVELPELVDRAFYLFGIIIMLLVDLMRLRGIPLNDLLIRGILLLCGVLSYLFSGDTVGLSLMVVIVGVASVGSIDTVISYWSLLTLLTIASVIIFFFIEVLSGSNNVPLFFQRGVSDAQKRLSLGFEHPNSFASLCLMLIIAVWKRDSGDRVNKKAFLFYFLSIVVYFLTRSRVALLLSLFYISMRIIIQKSSVVNKQVFKFRKILFLAPALLFAVTYLLAGPLYDDRLAVLFTNRVRLWHSFYLGHGLTLFGQPFESSQYVTQSGIVLFSSTLDSAYAYCLFVGGCAIGMSLIFLLILYSKKVAQEDTWQIVGLLVVLMLGFTETTAVWIMASGPIVYVASGLMGPLREMSGQRA